MSAKEGWVTDQKIKVTLFENMCVYINPCYARVTTSLVDVCTDIYVMMNSNLYGTCSHCIYGTNFAVR